MKRRNLKKWAKKVKNQEDRNILDNCLINPKVLQHVIATSNLCKHVSNELTLANFDKDGYFAMYAKSIMELVAVISYQNHSGFSFEKTLKLFNNLFNFRVLTPLTLKDDEWRTDTKDPITGSIQNIRYNSIFKEEDGTIIDINAYTKMPTGTYCFDTKQWKENNNKICWKGRLYEHENNILTGRYFDKCAIILDAYDTYMPKSIITIPCIEIEVGKYNWIMCVAKNENKLKILNKLYKILWQTNDKLKGVDVTNCEILSKL